jgi:putative ABC transport system permease protein
MQRGYAAINPANINVWGTYFDQDLVDHIAGLPGVSHAEGSREIDLRLETSGACTPGVLTSKDCGAQGQWVAIHIKGMRDPGQSQINRVHLVEGVWPPQEGEIVIDRFKLGETNARLGDWVTLELPSNRIRRLKLVGVIQDETIGARSGAGGFFSAPAQGYVNQDTLDSLEQSLPDQYNLMLVTIQGNSHDPAALEAMAKTVRDEMEKNGVEIDSLSTRSSTDHPNLYLVRAVLAVLVVIGLLVVVLSGFLITNTLQAIMNQQVQQIGILKTVGGRRLQIAGIYLMLSLVYGLLAYLVALPLANQVAFSVVGILTTELNYTFYGQRFVPQVALLQGIIAILMPQLASLGPAWQGARISVQEALSGYSQTNLPDQGWLDRRIGWLRRRSLMFMISLRNTFRHKLRLALTLLTLTLGGAVFIATFNVRVSLMEYIDQITQYFRADVNITLDRSYRISQISDIIQEVPGVKSVEGWLFARTELLNADGTPGESVYLLAPPADSHLIQPILLQGRWVQPGDQNAIALSELFHDTYPDLKVGDTLRLRVNGDEKDWVVVGFFQLAGKISGLSAYTNYEYLAQITHQTGQAASYRVVSATPSPTLEQQRLLGKAIEAQLARYGIRVANQEAGLTMTQTASQGFNVLTGFLLFLALLTALVGSIGMAGTMSLNVMERTREIGVLRAVGASDSVLIRMVLVEGALIGLLSWVLGSLAAFPISQLLADSISLSLFGGTSSFGFTPAGFLLWLLVVAVLSTLASLLPARSAARLTIREVLSYE